MQSVPAGDGRSSFNAIRAIPEQPGGTMSKDTGNEDLQRDEPAEEHDGAQRGLHLRGHAAGGRRPPADRMRREHRRAARIRARGRLWDGISLLVTTPVAGGRRVELVENDPVIVRVFSRQSAFAFRASVLRACRLPSTMCT